MASFAASVDQSKAVEHRRTVLMAGVWISLCNRLIFSRIFGAPQLGRSRLS